jgi:hypothetical protein
MEFQNVWMECFQRKRIHKILGTVLYTPMEALDNSKEQAWTIKTLAEIDTTLKEMRSKRI